MTQNYKKTCLAVVRIARNTGKELRKKRKMVEPEISLKGRNDFVTQFDKETEAKLIMELGQLLPEAVFIAEESVPDGQSGKYKWIIDPIDGTTNFIHGLYPYTISIALMEDDKIVIGVVYEIGLDECFYAYQSGSAYLNGKKIHVSKVSSVADSLIAVGFPYTNFILIDKYMESLHFFMKNSHGLRRLGSAAVDLAYLACGRVDAFYEYDLKPWDVAAGAFIVQQAGGKCADFSGGNNYIFGKEIVATNGIIHDEFLKTTKSFLK
jgi:myo-inositol-1(or 4)-monophosphatase